jgi:hypothetical protein
MGGDCDGVAMPRRQAIARVSFLAAFLGTGAAIVAGCAASTVADRVPAAIGGLPEGAPPRPATPAAYPAVHDMPPARSTAVLTSEEQAKVEEELVAARNRNAAASGSNGRSGKANPASKSGGSTSAPARSAASKSASVPGSSNKATVKSSGVKSSSESPAAEKTDDSSGTH